MFGISSLEFLLILLVAVVALGPEKLPGIMRTVARVLSEFRKVKTDFHRAMNLELALQEQKERPQQGRIAPDTTTGAAAGADTLGVADSGRGRFEQQGRAESGFAGSASDAAVVADQDKAASGEFTSTDMDAAAGADQDKDQTPHPMADLWSQLEQTLPAATPGEQETNTLGVADGACTRPSSCSALEAGPDVTSRRHLSASAQAALPPEHPCSQGTDQVAAAVADKA